MRDGERGTERMEHLLITPPTAHALLVLAHGAGAGMRHPFLETMARGLAERGIATFRYGLASREERKRRPDLPGVAEERVRAGVVEAARAAPGLPLLAGGKSFGGRMTSSAQATAPLSGVRGLVFFGFPLHPPGRPGTGRADHLDAVRIPLLFLQGTRDDFADLALLEPVCRRLDQRATLHIVEEADHSFRVQKRAGRTDADVLGELVQAVDDWTRMILA